MSVHNFVLYQGCGEVHFSSELQAEFHILKKCTNFVFNLFITRFSSVL